MFIVFLFSATTPAAAPILGATYGQVREIMDYQVCVWEELASAVHVRKVNKDTRLLIFITGNHVYQWRLITSAQNHETESSHHISPPPRRRRENTKHRRRLHRYELLLLHPSKPQRQIRPCVHIPLVPFLFHFHARSSQRSH